MYLNARWYSYVLAHIKGYVLTHSALTYLQTTRLLAHLDISLSLDVPVKTITKKQRKSDAAVEVALPVMYRDLALPELSAVCALIMVIKMRYGLDGTPRCVVSSLMRLD